MSLGLDSNLRSLLVSILLRRITIKSQWEVCACFLGLIFVTFVTFYSIAVRSVEMVF